LKQYYHHGGITPTMTAPIHTYNVFDRSRAMLDFPEIAVLTPIGKLCEPLSIRDLCANTVDHIVNIVQTKKIIVAWSGGIDSTMVLAEFLKTVPIDQLTVMMNNNSIKEYPEFYKKYIENKIEIVPMDFYNDSMNAAYLENSVIVTGCLMDQTFGCRTYEVMPSWMMYQTVDSFISTLNSSTAESYLKIIAACPRTLANVKDFIWWFNYLTSYQDEEIKWALDVPASIIGKNIFHFANGPDWNDFAVSTDIEVKYPGNSYNDYKMLLKKQLYEFTKDEQYTRYKVKVVSWRKYRTAEQRKLTRALYIDTNWTRGYSF